MMLLIQQADCLCVCLQRECTTYSFHNFYRFPLSEYFSLLHDEDKVDLELKTTQSCVSLKIEFYLKNLRAKLSNKFKNHFTAKAPQCSNVKLY